MRNLAIQRGNNGSFPDPSHCEGHECAKNAIQKCAICGSWLPSSNATCREAETMHISKYAIASLVGSSALVVVNTRKFVGA
jgi:hypothetical protein